MKRLKCTTSYDGTNFHGFQKQPKKRTIQGEIETALRKIHKGQEIPITGSGRTDATVHAYGQVFHFDTFLEIEPLKWKKAIQASLPLDIQIIDVEEVEETFHARFDVVRKEYRYRVLLTKDHDVFRRHYCYHFPYTINVETLKEASTLLIGTHDFSSFCASNTQVVDKIRTIYEIDIWLEGDELVFRFVGNGFLYNMVRIIVGTLLEVGTGKRAVEEIKIIVDAKSRDAAGKTVPGHGLYLWKVSYNNSSQC